MGRFLAANVHLVDGNGDVTVYRAGSTPPPKVAKAITNPSAWAYEDDDDAAPPPPPPSTPPAPPVPVIPADDSAGNGEPARNGKTEAWQAFAEGLGQTVEADAGRDEIIAQLIAAGLIKE